MVVEGRIIEIAATVDTLRDTRFALPQEMPLLALMGLPASGRMVGDRPTPMLRVAARNARWEPNAQVETASA